MPHECLLRASWVSPGLWVPPGCALGLTHCVRRRIGSSLSFALHWAVFLSLLWTAFLWAVLLSLPLAAMNLVRRVARDGLAWTLQEFQQHYGPNNWESAWAEAHRPVPPSTRQPTVHDHQPPRSGSASQPTSPVTVQLDDYGSDWESAQSTVHDHQAPRSGSAPQPEGAAQPAVPFGRRLNVDCELEALPVVASADMLVPDLPNPLVGHRHCMCHRGYHRTNAFVLDREYELRSDSSE